MAARGKGNIGFLTARSTLVERQTRGRPVHNFVDKVYMESADEFVRYFF